MPSPNEPLQANEVGAYGDLMARPNPEELVVLTVPPFESMLPFLARQAGRELSAAEIEAEHKRAPSIALTKDAAEKMGAARAGRARVTTPPPPEPPQESRGRFADAQVEPLFMRIPQEDNEFRAAYARAAAGLPLFIERIARGGDAMHSAKLRFRDPDQSERLGEDRFLFLWLGGVHYYPAERRFSGTFFEVPSELQKWHQVGQHLAFDPEDIFDWMALQQGHLHGGYTLRVAREKLPEAERESYDRFLGVSVYEPLPT